MLKPEKRMASFTPTLEVQVQFEVYKYNYAGKKTNRVVPLLDSAKQLGLTASGKQNKKTNETRKTVKVSTEG